MANHVNQLQPSTLKLNKGHVLNSCYYSYYYYHHPISRTSMLVRVNASAKQLIESGTIRSIRPKEAAAFISSEGFKLLDVRPEWEREKARVAGSLHVPLFIKDTDSSPVTLLKKWVHFGYIGLWTGQQFTTINPDFSVKVEGLFPDKNGGLLVACGEGLRSMMAAKRLHEAGYRNLGWLAGGFNRADDDDFSVEGNEKLQYAAVGGVSYYFLRLLILLQAVDKKE